MIVFVTLVSYIPITIYLTGEKAVTPSILCTLSSACEVIVVSLPWSLTLLSTVIMARCRVERGFQKGFEPAGQCKGRQGH